MKSTKLRRFGFSIAAVALAFALLGTSAAMAGASGVHKKKLTPLQQGMNYYNGKTIIYVDPSSPGGGVDSSVRAMAPYIGDFLHATIDILNNPNGNTIGGSDQAAASAHNGLTLGFLNSLSDVLQVTEGLPGITFDLSKQNIVGTPQPEAVYGWIESNAANCPQFSSWNAMLSYASTTKVLTESAGAATVLADLALATFKQHTQLINAYSTEALLESGFERGDGCVVTGGANKMYPFIENGFAHPLALTGPVPPGEASAWAGTPSFAQIIKSDAKMITTRTQKAASVALTTMATGVPSMEFLPRGTPQDEVDAMEAAIKWTAHNANFKAASFAVGNAVEYVPASKGQSNLKLALKSLKPFKAVLANAG